jgi:hypothetical protein
VARGLPSCGSAEMTGLYGLELRTVTSAQCVDPADRCRPHNTSKTVCALPEWSHR